MNHSISLSLDVKTIHRIRRLAASQNTTPSDWVRHLVLEKVQEVQELDGFDLARQRALHAMAHPIDVADASTLSRTQFPTACATGSRAHPSGRSGLEK